MAGGDAVEFFKTAPPGGHSCGIICSTGILRVSPILPSHPEVEWLREEPFHINKICCSILQLSEFQWA